MKTNSLKLLAQNKDQAIADQYATLVSRNKHFISKDLQKKISEIRVFIAGCGAAGGACIESLIRLGVTHMRIADSGSYELANLNRQHTFQDQIGKNKAIFHKEEVLRINPHVDIEAYPSGVTEENVQELVEWADIVIDGIDVTVYESICVKFKLHEVCHALKKPTLSPIDPGFCQMGLVFDYRKQNMKPIFGRMNLCREKAKRNPIQGLLIMFPLHLFPNHSMQLLLDLLHNPDQPASQLGCASDVLSGIISSIIVKFANNGKLPKSWSMELAPFALTLKDRLYLWFKAIRLKHEIRRILFS